MTILHSKQHNCWTVFHSLIITEKYNKILEWQFFRFYCLKPTCHSKQKLKKMNASNTIFTINIWTPPPSPPPTALHPTPFSITVTDYSNIKSGQVHKSFRGCFTKLGKQFRPWSDCSWGAVWSVSKLFSLIFIFPMEQSDQGLNCFPWYFHPNI